MAELVTLTPDEINTLRAGKNRSSEYRDLLDQFVSSGDAGVDISNSFPGKKLVNLANSFKRLTNKPEYAGVEVLHVTVNGAETLALIRK